MKRFLAAILMAAAWWHNGASAQSFHTLTDDEVKVDSVLPTFGHSWALGARWADSTYTVSIEYPEFIDMTEAEVSRYHLITTDTLPALPEVSVSIGANRKQARLDVGFVPLAYRDGRYQKLVSFKLAVSAKANATTTDNGRMGTRATEASSRYAESSVLASGTWAKIRVPASGVYQITDQLARQAGFASAADIRVYGYGGAKQPETLTGDYLTATDDLRQVAQCVAGGRRLFYAQGPVSWDDDERVRNPYSDYGYYLITNGGDEPLIVDSAEFVGAFYPAGEDYNALYEVDNYAWFQGGSNLYDSQRFTIGEPRQYTLAAPGPSASGTLTVVITANARSQATVSLNGTELTSLSVDQTGEYEAARSASRTYRVTNIEPTNTITITQTSGGTMRLDYIALHTSEPKAAPQLSTASFDTPEYLYRITNQDLHAHGPADMVIIIPTTQLLREQAERIKQLHEEHDSMRVRIVPADEIYNEFSSGTPDATAYRRYMKMLYDRAETEADMPGYLLLFGDGTWDNRMLTSDMRGYSPDDFLLCYESENSFSDTQCYVCDDFFCLLDDGEQIRQNNTSTGYRGRPDVAVGRFPVRTVSEAQAMVDKTIAYVNNEHAGSWQNTIVVMGDDGNNNTHMRSADAVASQVQSEHPGYHVRKIMWDAYTRETSATGNTYPDVSTLVRQYMRDGALVMNYSGHGVNFTISHEQVVSLADFQDIATNHLPLWLTASCDIMPFDGTLSTIGETAVLNATGGAVAFYGTTRTVYSSHNERMNLLYMSEVLSTDGGGVTIGEAARRAKVRLVDTGQDQTTNKLHYALLGDPAIKLACPKLQATIDSIDGRPLTQDSPIRLSAGSTATVKGRIMQGGALASSFNGTLTATVSDAEQEIVCKLNNTGTDGATTAFHYYDRSNVVYQGSDYVTDGEYTFTFVVPVDISYSDDNALINLYAASDDHSMTAHGASQALTLNGTGDLGRDSIGPSIYCYLNSPAFANGGTVNTTPYFYAQITDEDGINASGSGIGHDMQLSIDGEAAQTYVLNDYFAYDFGSYTSGSVGYSIPALTEGHHTLRFRVWDILNNASTAQLTFYVSADAQPTIFDVACSPNPATTSTSFSISHDRSGSQMDVRLDLYDMAGRHLWRHEESGVSTSDTYTLDWDLTIDGGRPLGTGVYIYRVGVSTDGSDYATKAKKLIVISNK